jgi:hypothetical protein
VELSAELVPAEFPFWLMVAGNYLRFIEFGAMVELVQSKI